jgi:hypothetical protein
MLHRGTLAVITAALIAVLLPASEEVSAKQRSAADKALFDKAVRDCNGPRYPNGARIDINYKKGTYRCVEPTNNDRR